MVESQCFEIVERLQGCHLVGKKTVKRYVMPQFYHSKLFAFVKVKVIRMILQNR